MTPNIDSAHLPPPPGQLVPLHQLHAWTAAILQGAGCTPAEAATAADNLTQAEATGHTSHGVVLLPSICDNLLQRRIQPGRAAQTVVDNGAFLVLDAGACFGMVQAWQAMARGIERARASGLCLLGLRNASHVGRLGHYAEQACAAGLVAIMFASTQGRAARVAPTGSTQGRLSSNPACIAVPRGKAPAVVMDFATSATTIGGARVAQLQHQALGPGRLLDAEGLPTREPHWALQQPLGVLLPAGEHKGAGLGLMCEILAGVLLGADTPVHPPAAGTPPRPGTVNSYMAVLIDPARLGEPAEMNRQLDELLRWYGSAAPLHPAAPVRYPGQRAAGQRARSAEQGVLLAEAIYAQLRALGERLAPGHAAP